MRLSRRTSCEGRSHTVGLSLGAKLMLSMLVTVVVVLGTGFYLIARHEANVLMAETEEKVALVAALTQHSVGQILNDIQSREAYLRSLPQRVTGFTDLRHVVITDARGDVLAEHRNGDGNGDLQASIDRHIQQVLSGARRVSETHPEWGIYHRFASIPSANGTEAPATQGVLGMEWSLDRGLAAIERDSETVLNLMLAEIVRELQEIDAAKRHLQDIAEQWGQQAGIKHVEVLDQHGRIIAHTREQRIGEQSSAKHRRLVAQVMASGRAVAEHDLSQGLYNHFEPVRPVSADPEAVPGAVIEIVADPAVVLDKADRLRQNLFQVGLILALALTSILLWVTRKTIVYPVRQLVGAMRAAAQQGSVSPAVPESGDELGELGQTFKRMVEQRRQFEKDLHESEARARGIVNSTIDGIITIDAHGTVQSFNAAAENIFGYSESEVIGNNVSMLMPAPHRDQHDQYLHNYLQTGKANIIGREREAEGLRRDGSLIPIALRVSEMRYADEHLFVGVIQDITERQEVFSKLDYLASHDSLTGLPNRTLFRDRLQQAMARASRHARMAGLLFLDLNGFKQINDSFGHEAGDQLLRAVAGRLKEGVRETDTVARLAGDEFTVVMDDITHADQVARVANKILQAFSLPFVNVDGHDLTVSVSIGIALYPHDSLDIDRLIQAADTAMYHAKSSGRNKYRLFSDEMMTQASQQQAAENRLSQAWERGELAVYFQPLIDVKSTRVIGGEALLRWRHPEQGLVSADQFAALLDRSGLIVPVTRWVLEQTGVLYGKLREAGAPLTLLSVNLSTRMLQSKSLLTTVIDSLEQTGMAPEHLVLELAEHAMVEDLRSADIALRTLKGLGIRIALDDFGTGQSSLTHLRRSPIDVVKIDRDLIRNIHVDQRDGALVHAIIAMARSLELLVVAEGVEDQRQFDFLRQNSCDAAQGFLFSEAVTPEEFVSLLKTDAPGEDALDSIATTAANSR